MTHHLYALLVGINEYDGRSHVSPLRGCTNDVEAIKTYLETQVDSSKTQLNVRMLLDEKATRWAVIDGFREHLQQARSGDTVLFYYAGHGSQDRAPEEFWRLNPSRLNETLVCYDSRTEGSWDLADKELAKLIAEVSEHNPHITVVLDCCHSGSGTRTGEAPVFATRQAPVDERDRPLESFIISPAEVEQVKAPTRSLDASSTGWIMPQGRHVLIAACRDTEEASEYSAQGQPCGAFSHFLLDTLYKAKGKLTYRDLFKATYAKTIANVSAQSPQIEAPYLEDFDQPFLGGLVEPFPAYFTLSYSSEIGWHINGGAIHGIQPPLNNEATRLALFPLDSNPADLQQLRGAIAPATVTDVQPQISRTETPAALERETTYKAVITYLPVPPLTIFLAGDSNRVDCLRQALPLSSYLKEVTDIALAKFRVVGDKTGYTIIKSAEAQGATTEVRDRLQDQPSEPVDTVNTAVRILAHIAQWTQVAQMSAPTGRQLPANAVELQIYHKEQLVTAESLRLHYEQQDQRWRSPHIKLKLINHSARRLYCTLLNLTEEYSISAPFFGSGGIWLEAHSEIWASIAANNQLSDLIPSTVPQRLWEQGVTEYQDTLKLIASTTEFDPTLLLQNKLGNSDAIAHRSLDARSHKLFGHLMNGIASRDIGEAIEIETVDEWMVSQRIITTVRPPAPVQISSERTVALATNNNHQRTEQVIICPHSQLKAEAQLIAMDQATRSAAIPLLPPLLQKQTEPLTFTARRGTAPGLDALELSEIEQAESVTPDNPLTLLIDVPLAPGESVLPIAYDGEFFIPLGYGHRRGKKTEVVLQRLPPPSVRQLDMGQFGDDLPVIETRSISSALKIVFRKVATQTLGETLSQKLGLSFEYPILAAVEKTAFTETYIADVAELESRVASAKNIVIYVHGITDSTQSMLPSIQTAHVNIEGQTRPLGEVYDLILTYDYESLNTSVAASAVQLKRKLAAIGILPGHNKTVHIIAHSMGGLVSRWLIEKEGGDAIIQHLIMLGTPNAGSPWPVVQAGLFRALSFAINGLSTVVWPVQLINGALYVLEAVDVALDDMNPGSELLTLLAASEPAIPYSIVAGNTSLIPLDDKTTLRTRLERKLDKLAEFPFLQEANDVAVSVSSIRHVPAGSIHVPQVREVACNHMVYFTDPVGLAGLSWAVECAFLTEKELTEKELTAIA